MEREREAFSGEWEESFKLRRLDARELVSFTLMPYFYFFYIFLTQID